MTAFTRVLVLCATLLLLCCCDTPMSKYAPINDTEKELIDILGMYLEARNGGDVKKLASLFEDGGEYVAGDGNKYTAKEGIANSDPVWWTQYGKQKIFNPKFQVENDLAKVSITGKWGLQHRYPQTFTLVRRDGKWRFTRIAIE